MNENRILPCPYCDTLNRVPGSKPAQDARCGRCHKALFEGHPVALTTRRFDVHARAQDIPLVVDFWAEWCGPCRGFAPTFEAAAREFEPRLRFAKVDSDREPELSQRFQIRSIPTLLMMQGGRELARVSGALPMSELRRWIGAHLPQ